MEHTGFPSDETLAAFLDGKLDPDTRRRVVEHMTTCDECYATVVAGGGVASSNHVDTARGPIQTWRFAGSVAASLTLLVLGLVVINRYSTREPSPAKLLAAAIPSKRQIEGRLSIVPFQSRVPAMRGGDTTGQSAARTDWRLLAVVGQIEERVQRNPTVDNLHVLGAAYLQVGSWNASEDALERAVKQQTSQSDARTAITKSHDAPLLTDLSVAYYCVARYTRKSSKYGDAVEAAETAWRQQHTPLIAWNRAVAIDALHIRASARQAWQDYLSIAGSDPEVPAATIRMKELSKSTDSQAWDRSRHDIESAIPNSDSTALRDAVFLHPGEARRYAEDVLFSRWGRALLSNDVASAARTLVLATEIGNALVERDRKDTLVADAALAIKTCAPPCRHMLATQHSLFGDALTLRDAHRYADAELEFKDASVEFGKSGNPFTMIALLYAAACAYDLSEYDKALVLLDEVDTIRNHQRRPLFDIAGRLHWIRGITEASLGHLTVALGEYRLAGDALRQSMEVSDATTVGAMIATLEETIGDREAAWKTRLDSLEAAERIGARTGHTPRIFLAAAHLAIRERKYATAELLLNETISASTAPVWEPLQVVAFASRSIVRAARGDGDGALADERRSVAIASKIGDTNTRSYALANSDVIRARLPFLNSSEQIQVLQDAVDFSAMTKDHLRLGDLLWLLSDAYAQIGEVASARAAIDRAISELESQAPSDETLEEFYADGRRNIYDRAIMLFLDAGDEVQAFRTFDRSRSFWASAKSSPRLLSSLPCSLAENEAVLAFRSTDNELLVWAVSSRRVKSVRLQVHQVDVVGLRDRLVGSSASRRLFDESASKLYDLLIKPMSDELSGKSIIVVPDQIVADIPFGALRDPVRGRYLIEDHLIVVAPSLSKYFFCKQRADELRQTAGNATVLLSGMSDATGAEPLASVRRELARLLVIYPRAILVENDELTKTRWVQAAVMSRTVHFAGHALSNSRNPRYSALLLSDQSSSDNALYAFEISRLRFKRTAVVVLNACATGAAAESLGNNSANVATAFLNAGVPSVIANLWPVRDGDSEALIVELHARMKAGISTASALRGAQLKVIEQTSPSVWAALEVMGADSN